MAEIAVELFFDSATEAIIRSMWDVLERQMGLKTPLQRHSRPHVSLVNLDGFTLAFPIHARVTQIGLVNIDPNRVDELGVFALQATHS